MRSDLCSRRTYNMSTALCKSAARETRTGKYPHGSNRVPCPDVWLGLIASAIESLGLASGIPAKWANGHVLICRKPTAWPDLGLLRVTRGFCADERENPITTHLGVPN